MSDREQQIKLAKIGLNALIDEATGYQQIRPKDDLATMAADLGLGSGPSPADPAPAAGGLDVGRVARLIARLPRMLTEADDYSWIPLGDVLVALTDIDASEAAWPEGAERLDSTVLLDFTASGSRIAEPIIDSSCDCDRCTSRCRSCPAPAAGDGEDIDFDTWVPPRPDFSKPQEPGNEAWRRDDVQALAAPPPSAAREGEALRLLRYLWQEADLDPPIAAVNGYKVRDLFEPSDQLSVDIDDLLAALEAEK